MKFEDTHQVLDVPDRNSQGINDRDADNSKDVKRSAETVVVAVFTVTSVVLFAAMLYFIATHAFFNPDEAYLESSLREAASAQEFNETFPGGGIVSRRIFFMLHEHFNLGIMGRKVIACSITFLLLLYVLYLSVKYYGISGYGIFVPVSVMAINSPLAVFGTWSWFTYSVGIAFSAVMIHIAAVLRDIGRLNIFKIIMVALLLMMIVFQSVRYILPVTILVFVYCLYHALDIRRDYRNALKVTLGGPFMALPAALTALYILTYKAHREFREPRQDIWGYYFPLSELPETLQGVATFWFTRTETLMRTIWAAAPYKINNAYHTGILFRQEILADQKWIAAMLGTLFVIGLVVSFFRWREKRFWLTAYVLLTWGAVSILGVAGYYAYGHVRYIMFIFVPVLLISALGLQDVGMFLNYVGQFMLRQFSKQKILLVRIAVFMAFAATMLGIQFNQLRHVASETLDYNPRLREVLTHIDAAQTDSFVWDYNSRSLLLILRPDYDAKDMFYFTRSFMRHEEEHDTSLEEWRTFLDRNDHVTALRYYDFFRYDERFNWPLMEYFNVTVLPSVSRWNLYRFERLPVADSLLPHKTNLAKWSSVGEVSVTSISDEGVFKVTLAAGASLCQEVGHAAKYGLRTVSEVTMWAEPPAIVGLAVEAIGSDGTNQELEGALRWYEIADTPKLYRLTHTFNGPFSGLRLRLHAPEEASVTFYLKSASLGYIAEDK